MAPHFTPHDLSDGLLFLVRRMPDNLLWDPATFNAAWGLHPAVRPDIHLHGRRVRIPRWQQAYGEDYRFSGQVSRALPVPDLLEPLQAWARHDIYPALNGFLHNWYEGWGHYIGPHHDSTQSMAPGAPIVTVSFGEERKFRLSRGKDEAKEVLDFPVHTGLCSSCRRRRTPSGSTRSRNRRGTRAEGSRSPSGGFKRVQGLDRQGMDAPTKAMGYPEPV